MRRRREANREEAGVQKKGDGGWRGKKREKQIKKGQLTSKEEKQTWRKKKCSNKRDKDGAVVSLGLLWVEDYEASSLFAPRL